jgi:hypothetical protein
MELRRRRNFQQRMLMLPAFWLEMPVNARRQEGRSLPEASLLRPSGALARRLPSPLASQRVAHYTVAILRCFAVVLALVRAVRVCAGPDDD